MDVPLSHMQAVRKSRPTDTIACRCAGRSCLKLWGEAAGSFEAGCCGHRTVFVKPAGTSGSSDPAGHPQIIRCNCASTAAVILRGPALGVLRCGACKESTEFVAMAVKPPRAALIDDEVAR